MTRQYTAVLCICLTLAAPCWAYYNPRIGRFLQRDPVGPVNPAVITPLVNRAAAFVPDHGVPYANREYHDGMNLYQYVRSNPLVHTDPSGELSCIEQVGVTGLVGGLAGMLGYAIADADPWDGFRAGAVGAMTGTVAWLGGLGLVASAAIGGVFEAATDHTMTDPLIDSREQLEVLVGDMLVAGAVAGLTAGALKAAAPYLAKAMTAMKARLAAHPSGYGARPPHWTPEWTFEPPTGNRQGAWRWFDSDGGEWRLHSQDKYHPFTHWDYNSWDNWNSPWRNVELGVFDNWSHWVD